MSFEAVLDVKPLLAAVRRAAVVSREIVEEIKFVARAKRMTLAELFEDAKRRRIRGKR